MLVDARPPEDSGAADWPEPGSVTTRVGPDRRIWILFRSGTSWRRAAIPLGPGAAWALADELRACAEIAEKRPG